MDDPELVRQATTDGAAPADFWGGTRIAPLDPVDPRITAVLDTCDGRRCFGGQFVVEPSPPVGWHLQHGTVDRTTFFRDFFADPGVAARIPVLRASASEASADATLGLRHMGTWLVTAHLASELSFGGVANGEARDDAFVLGLIRGIADAAFRSRYARTFAYFGNGGPERTFFWFDRERSLATAILICDAGKSLAAVSGP